MCLNNKIFVCFQSESLMDGDRGQFIMSLYHFAPSRFQQPTFLFLQPSWTSITWCRSLPASPDRSWVPGPSWQASP